MTAEAGIVDRDGRGLGVVAADLDDDGKIDLFVANDTTANYFFRNRGGFRFAEQGVESGLATNASGGYLAGMGVACGDFDGDGRLDLAVTNFYGESTTLYHNHGGGLFSDRTAAAGLAAPTRFVLGFGLAALDANNDGQLDLAQANGHVDDYRPTTPYAMPAQLFLGDARRQAHRRLGPRRAALATLRLGRGLAVGDLDNDGRIDLLIVAENAPLALLHNDGAARRSNTRPFPDPRARGNRLESRRRRRAGGRHRLGTDPGRRALRRRQLPVGERPASSLRPGTCPQGRSCRGHMALGPPRPLSGPRRRRRLPAARGQPGRGPSCGLPGGGELARSKSAKRDRAKSAKTGHVRYWRSAKTERRRKTGQSEKTGQERENE